MILDEYARRIFEKMLYPAVHPEDFPVKDGKFEVDYNGETLVVSVQHKDPVSEDRTDYRPNVSGWKYMILDNTTGAPVLFGPRSSATGTYVEARKHILKVDTYSRLLIVELRMVGPKEKLKDD